MQTRLAYKGTAGETQSTQAQPNTTREPSRKPGAHRHSTQPVSESSTPAPISSSNLPSLPAAPLLSLAPQQPPHCPPAATSMSSPPKATASAGQVMPQLTKTSEGCLTETWPCYPLPSYPPGPLCHLPGGAWVLSRRERKTPTQPVPGWGSGSPTPQGKTASLRRPGCSLLEIYFYPLQSIID